MLLLRAGPVFTQSFRCCILPPHAGFALVHLLLLRALVKASGPPDKGLLHHALFTLGLCYWIWPSSRMVSATDQPSVLYTWLPLMFRLSLHRESATESAAPYTAGFPTEFGPLYTRFSFCIWPSLNRVFATASGPPYTCCRYGIWPSLHRVSATASGTPYTMGLLIFLAILTFYLKIPLHEVLTSIFR
jgi:hypothetical protein